MIHIQTIVEESGNAEQLKLKLQQARPGSGGWQFAVLMAHYSQRQLVADAGLAEFCPAWLGCSSCQGIMTDQGILMQPNSLGMLLISDPQGFYGSGSALIGENTVAQATEQALLMALSQSGHGFQAPTLIWCTQPPGTEEAVLATIEQVIGHKVPVYGGSGADDDVSGQWWQFDGHHLDGNNVVISVLYPSAALGHFFHSGYVPTEKQGIVTKASGRTLYEIDHQPAVKVYSEWLGRQLESDVMMQTATSPLGTELDNEHVGMPLYLLSLPTQFESDGSIKLFAEVHEGQQLRLMHGELTQLLSRAGTMCECVRTVLPEQHCTGALIVFCGACMLSIRDHIDDVFYGVKKSLGDAPFLLGFTFGEQGYAVDQSNRHGNLMYSTVLLGQHHAD